MGYFFEAEQLVLQAFAPEHLADFHAYLNHPDLTGLRYIPGKFPSDLPLSKTQAENILKSWSEAEKQFHLAITLRENNTLIGHVNASWRWQLYDNLGMDLLREEYYAKHPELTDNLPLLG